MHEISLILPHQLFLDNPCILQGREVVLLEHDLYFNQFAFHKQKLMLHRASMMAYKTRLEKQGHSVSYISNEGKALSFEKLFQDFSIKGVSHVYCVEPDDYLVSRRIARFSKAFKIQVTYLPNPGFILTAKQYTEYYQDKKNYFLNSFYIDQRKQHNILLEKGEPRGGKWTFDTENRKKLPAGIKIPKQPSIASNSFVKEAENYIDKYYRSTYGTTEGFQYPTDHASAESVLRIFLEERFKSYGIYQDAIHSDESYLFHSILTPALNIGLLTPTQVIDAAVDHAKTHFIPINSLEGFVRQVLGWREFVRILYDREGTSQRKRNFFNHRNLLPEQFWTGTTGIPPVDNVIKKLLRTGYSNHIERLMIMGNFMLLCEIDPDEIYRWFMTLYIDAYDWVMVPNVYGMSQFADGGLMSTKPYISGSNYILKMSNYEKGEWCEVWDALYWCFIDKHKEHFIKNPRMSMMVKQLAKMNPERFDNLVKKRAAFMTSMGL